MPIQQMYLGLGAVADLKHTVSDNDTNLNAATIFGSDYTVDIAKVIIIPSGFEIGATGGTGNRALTIPSGLVGTLEIQNAGTISGAGGAGGTGGGGSAGSAGGSAIYIASNNVTVTNSGTIRGGGGGGGAGNNGNTVNNVYVDSNNNVNCIGGTGGNGGNGQGYNSAATNGASGGSRTNSWQQYGNPFFGIAQGACASSSYSNGGAGGNGGNFGASGGGNGGAGGKYVELAGGISYTASNSGTLTGNAP